MRWVVPAPEEQFEAGADQHAGGPELCIANLWSVQISTMGRSILVLIP